jgi:hypothetical protein
VVNAVADALRPLGIENDQVEKPVSAERVWRTIQASAGRAPAERVAEGGGTGAASMTPEEEGGVA